MDKQKTKLTSRSVASLKPQDKLYRVWDTEIPAFFVKMRPSGALTFGIFYRSEGKLKEFTIGKYGALTVDEARKEARAFAGSIAKGVDIQDDKQLKRRADEAKRLLRLGVFLESKYGPWSLQERKRGQETLDRLKLHFGKWYDKPMPDISSWLVTKWRSDRLKEGISPKTVNRDIGALKSVFSKAVEWKILYVHPLAELKPLKVDNREKQRFLSQQEERDLRGAIDARDAAMKSARDSANAWRSARGKPEMTGFDRNQFADYVKPLLLLLLNTGLRPKEAFELEWVDVDFKSKFLTVRGEKAKSGLTRHIPLNQEAWSTLLQWSNQSDSSNLVFPSPVTAGAIEKMPDSIYRVFRSAKLKDFRPYDLRHSFASKLVMAGVDLNTVRELLGHKDISTTLIYAHLAPDHKAAAVELLSK